MGNGSLNHSLRGVFDESFTYVDPDEGHHVTSQQLNLLVKLSDLPEEPVYRSQFEIRETIYLVNQVLPDGKGAARIFLMEADE